MAEGRLNARTDVAELELTGSDAQRLPGRVADRN
jgi:hypothetical protein